MQWWQRNKGQGELRRLTFLCGATGPEEDDLVGSCKVSSGPRFKDCQEGLQLDMDEPKSVKRDCTWRTVVLRKPEKGSEETEAGLHKALLGWSLPPKSPGKDEDRLSTCLDDREISMTEETSTETIVIRMRQAPTDYRQGPLGLQQ